MPRKKFVEDYYDIETMLKAQEDRNKSIVKTVKNDKETRRKMFATASLIMLFFTAGVFYLVSGSENGSVVTTSTGIIGKTLEPELVEAGQRKTEIVLEKSNLTIQDEMVDNSNFINSQMQIYDNEDIKIYMYIMNSVSEMDFGSPVAQNPSNTYYLDHNLNKQSDKSGAIFLDYNVDTTETPKNMVIYGSNQFENANLYNLKNYADKSFYDANKIIKIVEEDRNVYYEVFAFCEVTDTFKTEPTEFATELAFQKYISEIRNSAIYFDSVASDDDLITIATASNNEDGVRYKLYGKRINKVN